MTPLHHHLGHAHMVLGTLVRGAGVNFGAHVAPPIGHFLGPFIDQHDDYRGVGMQTDDRACYFLQQHRLASARRCDNQRALSVAYRRDQVD